jgi:hypothetical protein
MTIQISVLILLQVLFQELLCSAGSRPEVPAIRYYRSSAGMVLDCWILLAVIKSRDRGSRPEVPASRSYRPCVG